jgi:hypothetical protein
MVSPAAGGGAANASPQVRAHKILTVRKNHNSLRIELLYRLSYRTLLSENYFPNDIYKVAQKVIWYPMFKTRE